MSDTLLELLPYILGANGVLAALVASVKAYARAKKRKKEAVVIATDDTAWAISCGAPVRRSLEQGMRDGRAAVVLFRRRWTRFSLWINSVDYVVASDAFAESLVSGCATVVTKEMAEAILRMEDGAVPVIGRGGGSAEVRDDWRAMQSKFDMIGRYGCYFLSILRLVWIYTGVRKDVLHAYDKLIAEGIMLPDCTVLDAAKALATLGVREANQLQIAFAGPEAEGATCEYYFGCYKTKSHTHFVLMRHGLIEFDPLGDSNTVRNGALVSTRVLKKR